VLDEPPVRATDLGLLKSVFFGTDPNGDFDGDGQVNFTDLGAMKSFFFQPPGPKRPRSVGVFSRPTAEATHSGG
jgi:hypothetical protein